MLRIRKISCVSKGRGLAAVLILLIIMSGCSATRTQSPAGGIQTNQGRRQEALGALQSVTEAVSGKELTEAQMIDLARDIDKNEETQSAVKVITDSLQGAGIQYKYCPVCGKRYHPKFTYCPIHGVRLKEVEE